MGAAIGTFLLELTAAILRATGDVKAAVRVEKIREGRPDLTKEEAKLFAHALERLGRKG